MPEVPMIELKRFPDNADPGFSLDGDAFTLDQYLKSLANDNNEFYAMYDIHLRYFTSMFNIEGDKNIKRIWHLLMRQVIEFGIAGIAKINGAYVPMAIIDLEYKYDYTVKRVQTLPARFGYGLNKENKQWTFTKDDEIVIIKHNFQSLPFIFYWKVPLQNIISLRETALTASYASIKKFKRLRENNNNRIMEIENRSLISPRSPVVDVISNPQSYLTMNMNKQTGNISKSEKPGVVSPNALTFESNIESAVPQFDNLKNYTHFEYFMLGRRVNTNKKTERNVSSEIHTETINFDILENDFKRNLEGFVEQMKEQWSLDLTLVNLAELDQEGGMDNNEKPDGNFNNNPNR